MCRRGWYLCMEWRTTCRTYDDNCYYYACQHILSISSYIRVLQLAVRGPNCLIWPPKSLQQNEYTMPVKGLDTPTNSRAFLYLYYFLHCRTIVKTSILWNNTWNHVVTKKGLNISKYILYLRFFKVATLCLDDWGSWVKQWSKALHLSARGVTTDPGSIPGCITTGCDWESHRVAPSVVRVWLG